MREPLVDIHTEPDSPKEPTVQLKLGRKRLSDINGPIDSPTSDPKPQRRHLSDVGETNSQEPVPEPRPVSGRPRLSRVQTETTQSESPEDPGRSRLDDSMSASGLPSATAPATDPARIDRWIADLRSKQSLFLAAAAGSLAAVVGAMLWAAVTVITNAQIGWMAIGVAALVGVVVRTLGRGLDKSFGRLVQGYRCSVASSATTWPTVCSSPERSSSR